MAESFSRGLVSVEGDESLGRLKPVARPRLLGRLIRAAARKVTIVSAPAGFGKTIAVNQYLGEANPQHVDLSLRGAPSETIDFEKIVRSTAGLNRTTVVDNVHLAEPELLKFMSSAVERDDTRRWILSGRGMQELPISSWLAYGLTEMPIDDVDLRFDLAEARELAIARGVELTDGELEEMLDFSDGWPVALEFAYAARRKVDRIRAVDLSRDLVFDYLNEQVFRELDAGDRCFLLDTALLPSLDLEMLVSVDDGAAERIQRLARSTSFISKDSEKRFRYHDLFRRFLEHRLRAEGEATFRLSARKSAAFLEGGGRLEEALALYVESESWDNVVRVLHSSGFELLDREAMRTLTNALTVPAALRDRDPVLLALYGAVRAYDGKLEEADAYLALAAKFAAATDVEVLIAEHRAACLLGYGRASEALGSLEGIKVERSTGNVRARFLATKARVSADLGESAEASHLIAQALQDLKPLESSAFEAYVFYCASCCDLAAGRFDEVRSHAVASLRASHGRSPTIRAHVNLNLYLAARELGDDAECRKLLENLHEFRTASIDREIERRILAAEYIAAVEGGSTRAIGDIEDRIRNLEDAHASVLDPFQPVIAMQAAWGGDFAGAQRMLASSAKVRTHGGSDLLAISHLTLYAAAGGDRDAANEVAKALQELLQSLGGGWLQGRSAVSAQILLALAFLLLGRASSANNVLRELEVRTTRMAPALRSLLRTARAVYVHAETGAAYDELAAAIDDLSRYGLGGYGRLLRALPLPAQGSSAKFSALTPTELRVLRALATGETSRQIAATLGRSALTIDSHVKSLIKKLGCRGRHEAVAIARAQGLTGIS